METFIEVNVFVCSDVFDNSPGLRCHHSSHDDSLRNRNATDDARFAHPRHDRSQCVGDDVRGDTDEASHDARDVHILTSRGRRTGRPGCNARHDCVHNIRAVAARASALHAVGVH